MPQQNYEEQLETYIQNDLIECYSDDDITLDHMPFDHGGFAMVFKARIRRSGQLVVTKTLFLQNHETFAKEVTIESLYSLISLAFCIRCWN
jgi:hypothetical protein